MGATLLMLSLVAMSLQVPADSQLAVGSTFAKVRSLIRSNPVQINDSVSSSVFNESNVRSDIKCMMWCAVRGCAVASRNQRTGLCQLVVLNDVIKAAALPGSKVNRMVGEEADDHVWKVPNIDELLSDHRNSIRLFNNSGTGRTGSIQQFMVPVTGCYRIQALGARGGSNNPGVSNFQPGGNGALVSGFFSLVAGTRLSIVVGQRGGDVSVRNFHLGGGGGGGSFVYRSFDNHLLLAAGGGGGGCGRTAGFPGQNGTAGTDTTPCIDCNVDLKGIGGTNGQAGVINIAASTSTDYRGKAVGGAGAGWLGKATVARPSQEAGESGGSRADGWLGGQAGVNNAGAVGGFGGGGGGAGHSNCGGAGAGGGFSGGGAGIYDFHPGGGGGSFCGGSGCTGTTGGNTGSEQGSVAMEMMIGTKCA